MKKSLRKFLADFTTASPRRRLDRSRPTGTRRLSSYRAHLETLEERQVFAAPTLAALPNVTLLAGTSMQIPLDGFDADGDALTYSVSTTNPNVAAALSASTNRSLRMAVTHAPSNQPGDQAISGEMVFVLFEDLSPRATSQIISLAQAGFYNGLTFHRVINNFMIQGGDPTGNGSGGSGNNFDDQFHPSLRHTGPGLLSMAKSFDDTNDSQFFITEVPTRHLDFNHTIFGRLVEGDNIREAISNIPVTGGTNKPLSPVTMNSVSVFTDTQNRVLSISAPAGTTGTADITVTVTDGKSGSVNRTFRVTLGADDPNNNANPYLMDVPDVHTTANTPVTFQLPGTDPDGGQIAYLDHNLLNNNFYYPLLQPPNTPKIPLIPTDPDLEVSVNLDTGQTTVTPRNGVLGVHQIFVGVARDLDALDTQLVPIFIAPNAPTGVDLLTDTGGNGGDDITSLNNADANSKLQFLVSGVVAGTEVSILADDVVIGKTIATGTTATVTTNGTVALSNGLHSIKAIQSVVNHSYTVGNRSGTVNLPSPATAPMQIRISPSDWQNPNNRLDVDGSGTVAALDALRIINDLNTNGSHPVQPGPPATISYLDVDGNRLISPLDALQIINFLNTQSAQLSASAPQASPELSALAFSLATTDMHSGSSPALALASSGTEESAQPVEETSTSGQSSPAAEAELAALALSANAAEESDPTDLALDAEFEELVSLLAEDQA